MAEFDWNALPDADSAPDQKDQNFDWNALPDADQSTPEAAPSPEFSAPEPTQQPQPTQPESTIAGKVNPMARAARGYAMGGPLGAALALGNLDNKEGIKGLIGQLAEGITLGHTPQLAAAVGRLVPDPGAATDKSLEAQGFTVENAPDTYTEDRDRARRDLNQFQEEEPIPALVAQLTGGTLTGKGLFQLGKTLSKVGSLKKTADVLSKASRAKKAALGGGAFSALSNPGDTKGKTFLDDPVKEIKGRAVGGVTGALFSSLASKVLPSSKKLSEKAANLRTQSEGLALEKAGHTESTLAKAFKNVKDSNKRKAMKSAGRALIDEGIIDPKSPTTSNSMRTKLVSKVEELTSKVDDVVDRTTKKISDPKFQKKLPPRDFKRVQNALPRPKQIAEKIASQLDEVNSAELGKETRTNTAKNELQKFLKRHKIEFDDLESAKEFVRSDKGKMSSLKRAAQGDEEELAKKVAITAKRLMDKGNPLTLKKAQSIKRKMSRANSKLHQKESSLLTPTDEKDLALERGFKEAIEDSADEIARITGDKQGKIKALNRRQHLLLKSKNAIENSVGKEDARSILPSKKKLIGHGETPLTFSKKITYTKAKEMLDSDIAKQIAKGDEKSAAIIRRLKGETKRGFAEKNLKRNPIFIEILRQSGPTEQRTLSKER